MNRIINQYIYIILHNNGITNSIFKLSEDSYNDLLSSILQQSNILYEWYILLFSTSLNPVNRIPHTDFFLSSSISYIFSEEF